jgi:teichuronic acid biosynthesis glycosyltransferase TuaC
MTDPPSTLRRVLMLSRQYPSNVFPNSGLWVEHPTVALGAREGYEVLVVSPQPYCPPFPSLGRLAHYARFREITRAEVRNGIEVVRPAYPSGPGHTTSQFEAKAYAAAALRALGRLPVPPKFDLIHAHFVYPEGAAARLLGHHLRVPFVISEHAPWTRERFSKASIRRHSLEAGRAAGVIMAVSEFIRASILEWRPDAVTSIVPEGADGDLFRLSPDGRYVEDQILFVGWLNYNKGVDVLLRAMAMLRDRGARGRLLLVGGSYFRSTRIMEGELRQLAQELDLGDRVTFLGSRPQEEVARLMAASAVVVLPSRAEAFGTVLAEALCCGTPVVSSMSGGPEDYVTPELGRLVPVGDAGALATALADVLERRASFEGSRLRQVALEQFSWSRVVDGWVDAYAAALESREAAPPVSRVALR